MGYSDCCPPTSAGASNWEAVSAVYEPWDINSTASWLQRKVPLACRIPPLSQLRPLNPREGFDENNIPFFTKRKLFNERPKKGKFFMFSLHSELLSFREGGTAVAEEVSGRLVDIKLDGKRRGRGGGREGGGSPTHQPTNHPTTHPPWVEMQLQLIFVSPSPLPLPPSLLQLWLKNYTMNQAASRAKTNLRKSRLSFGKSNWSCPPPTYLMAWYSPLLS